MMGMVPFLFLIYLSVPSVATDTIIMPFMTKVQKPLAIFILGMLSPLLMFSMGHTYILIVHLIIVIAIAELIRRAGDYKSFKHNMFSFAIFNTWICGSIMQVLLAKDRYLEMTVPMAGEEFASGMEKLVTYPNMALVCFSAILGEIIGANGLGKSAFTRCLIGVERKSKEEIYLYGKKLSKKERLKMSSLVMQDVNHQLFTDSVINEVCLGIKDAQKDKVEELLEELNLYEFKDRHPMSLSGEQKQRVAIASVIYKNSKLIFFDKPTSGMDYVNMMRISELIKECKRNTS